MKYRLFILLLCLFCLKNAFAQLVIREDSIKTNVPNDTVELPEVEVVSRSKNIDSRGLGNLRINMEQLRRSPLFFGERDLVKTLQFLPGVSGGMEGSSQLNIRGGTNDQTLYLLDDVPVYNQNHTFGFFSVFNADALQSADIYKGGIPSLYGDRLSGVVSVALKDGSLTNYNHSFTLGLLAGTIASDGPIIKNKLSYSIAARRSFLDLLYNGIMKLAEEGEGGIGMISFYDVNGKLTWQINPRNKLTWQIYSGYDDVYGMNKETDNYENWNYSEKFGFGWKTLMSSFRLLSEIKPSLRLASTLYYTHLDNFNYFKNKETNDGRKSSMENGTSDILDEVGWKAAFTQTINNNNTLFYGVETSYQAYMPNFMYKKTRQTKLEYNKEKLKLYTGSAYLYDEHRLNNWLFGVGIRASAYNNTNKTLWVVEPRIKINTFVGERNKLMLAFDYMHQPVHSINEMNYSVQTDFWVPFKEDILPSSKQFSIGWKNYTTPEFTFSVEAYHKTMKNLLLIKNLEYYMDFHSDYEIGRGNSMGMELMAEYSKKKFTSWASYTLSKSKREFEGVTYPYKYDSPHDVSLFAGYDIWKRKENINSLSVNMQYKSGYPYYVPEISHPSVGLPTLAGGYAALDDIAWVDYIPNYPNIRLKDFFRMDVNFTMNQKLKHGSRIWQFSLLNATAHQNPYAIYKKDGRYKAFMLIPFLPSISVTRKF